MGCRKKSMKEEMRSVGPLMPETIGLIPKGVLWILVEYVVLLLLSEEN